MSSPHCIIQSNIQMDNSKRQRPWSAVDFGGTIPASDVECCRMQVIRLSEDAKRPTRESPGAAGYDLYSAENCRIPGWDRSKIGTKIAIKIPPGHYGRIAPRSSMAWKNKTDVCAGVLDEDYRGEVIVILANHDDHDLIIEKGDRIAQLIIERISHPIIEEVDSLDETERGEGGFGSTGK